MRKKIFNWFKKHPEIIVLGLILILAFGLRIFKIDQNPASLNWDETSHGFNAYSILKTGKDEWGISWPTIFRCFGDFKLPLYIYLTIIPVWTLGLNALSVRLVSILSGVGLVLVAYLIGKEVTKKKAIGLMSAFLASIMPWGLFLSRVAVEANLAVFLFSLAGWFLIKWFKNKRANPLVWSAVFFGLSLHAYNSARVLVPLVILFTLITAIRQKRLRDLILPAFIMAVFIIPIGMQMMNDSASARFFWVNPIDQGVVNQINEKRGQSQMPELITRLVYNRPIYFVKFAALNYIKHFSPRFWFLTGGDHYQFSFPETPLVFGIIAPFLLLGTIKLVVDKKLFLIFWLLAGFIPSAITKDAPHVLRIILAFAPMMIISSIGLFWLKDFLAKNSRIKGYGVLGIVLFGLLAQLVIWWQNYWQIYRIEYAWAWQDGYKEAVEYIKENYSQYDRIIMTKKYGEPHEFILFYWPWNPKFYQQDTSKVWDYHANWYWVDGFDKFEFWNDWEVVARMTGEDQKLEGRVLLIAAPDKWLKTGELLKTIKSVDGNSVFDIVEYRGKD